MTAAASVLVVDDHPVFRRGIASLLEASGYVLVGEAGGVVEAIKKLSAAQRDPTSS